MDEFGSFENFKEVLPVFNDKSLMELTLANTRARIRMTTLYYIAGIHSCLVAGTGNKVEDFGVGFYTKYGDGGVDLSPIADLLKSEVFSLAKALGVPDSIQTAAPTDGLFGDSRTDEDQIGASYDELEWAMEMCEKGKSSSNFVGRQQEVFKIYNCLNNLNRILGSNKVDISGKLFSKSSLKNCNQFLPFIPIGNSFSAEMEIEERTLDGIKRSFFCIHNNLL